MRPSLDLVGHAVKGSKARLGVRSPVAGCIIDRGVLVDVDGAVEPVDKAPNLVPGGSADSPQRLEEILGGNVGAAVDRVSSLCRRVCGWRAMHAVSLGHGT